MIRFLAWPQLSTAAAFVTAVAVVLNPVSPGLPDITVPALFPPGVQTPLPAAQPKRPAVGPTAPVVVAPTLRSPAVAAAMTDPATRWQPALPAYIADPTMPAAPAVVLSPGIEISTPPEELPATPPTAPPPFHVEGLPAHAGDRRLPISRQGLGPLADPRPLPAAAVDSPETPTPDSGVVTSRGRGGLARPDTKEPSRRGHRGGD